MNEDFSQTLQGLVEVAGAMSGEKLNEAQTKSNLNRSQKLIFILAQIFQMHQSIVRDLSPSQP